MTGETRGAGRGRHSVEELAQGVLEGKRLLLARAISQVENETPQAQELLRTLFPHTGQAHIVGITGAPGTGKSTLVSALTRRYREAGLRVAVVAVDPTSPFTGGALLGDRVRMVRHSGDRGVFIRSMATRGTLGGLAKTTSDVITVLDAAGFQRILVETVGVGQAEVDIASTAHTTVVVEAPGLGDEVQAIKAGILEIADIFVVNKADRPGAARTVTALEMMLQLGRGAPRTVLHHGQLMRVERPDGQGEQGQGKPGEDNQGEEKAGQKSPGWEVKVLKSIATTGSGVEDLQAEIERHRAWLLASGEMEAREQARVARMLEGILQAELKRRMLAALSQETMAQLIQAVSHRRLDPYSAAQEMLQQLVNGQRMADKETRNG